MTPSVAGTRPLGPAVRDSFVSTRALGEAAGFVELFVWLLVLRGFFLPLFIIPTGSMAETLAGAYATHTCPNCGYEQQVGFRDTDPPYMIECPNCRWQLPTARFKPEGVKLSGRAGDRIVVHGWTYAIGGALGPQRWDVVVFKNVNDPQQNYIKRLVGLPGETIEIIDGDLWVTAPNETEPKLARKPHAVQEALWFSQYDHDFIPRQAATDRVGFVYSEQQGIVPRPRFSNFKPQFVTVAGTGWQGLDERVLRVDPPAGGFSQVQFSTRAGADSEKMPGEITNIYGYNGYELPAVRDRNERTTVVAERDYLPVNDVRVSATVEFDSGTGFVELCVTKYHHEFYARLYADGRVTLEHDNSNERKREVWASEPGQKPIGPVRFSLGHADYQVVVELDGREVLRSDPKVYSITPTEARARAALNHSAYVRLGAESVKARVSHVRIDRDVQYESGLKDWDPVRQAMFVRPGTATQGHPAKLPHDGYMVFGDNSTQSQDSRYWEGPPGPDFDGTKPGQQGRPLLAAHLHERYARGEYTLGTVPADQMIGRAFLVYWPGFMPLFPWAPDSRTLLPDLGRVRWIH